jgi:hypothetical protein
MTTVDINKAMANPVGIFGHPENVLKNESLTKSQKREVLLRWKAEAVHMQESDAEGFGGGERSRIDEITQAIGKLA